MHCSLTNVVVVIHYTLWNYKKRLAVWQGERKMCSQPEHAIYLAGSFSLTGAIVIKFPTYMLTLLIDKERKLGYANYLSFFRTVEL